MSAGLNEGMRQADRSIAGTAILNTADPGPTGGGTYSGVDTETMAAQYENVFGPAARDIKWDTQRHKRHQRWHLPDALKGANTYLTDRIDGLITDATNSPFTKNILPYVYLEQPDQKIKWNVYNFDEGIASRVPYEAAARVLPQSKRSFSGYAVRHGLALALEHNFMMSATGRKNFQDQLMQLVGSIQMTNDIDVHMALLQAPSYQKTWDEKYIDKGLTTSKICRQYIDLFGIMQKNDIGLDILIEDAKTHLKTWGSQPPSFLMCNGALTRQLTMTPEKTNYVTNGPDGARRLAQGPELPSYRGLSIINTRKFSMEQGQAPRDLLRRRVRVAEHYHVPFDDASKFNSECGCVKTVQAPMPSIAAADYAPVGASEETLMYKTRFQYVEPQYPRHKGPCMPATSCEVYDQTKDSMVRFSFGELIHNSLLCPGRLQDPANRETVNPYLDAFFRAHGDAKLPALKQIWTGDLADRNGVPNVCFRDDMNRSCVMSCLFLPSLIGMYVGQNANGINNILGAAATFGTALEGKVKRERNEAQFDAENEQTRVYFDRLAQQIALLMGSFATSRNNRWTAKELDTITSWSMLFDIMSAVKQLDMMYSIMDAGLKAHFVRDYATFKKAQDDNLDVQVSRNLRDLGARIKPHLHNYQLEADILILRPNIEHEMLGIIMGRGGTQELGATFWGQTELSCYDDAQHGIWGMSYKYHERAIVTNERNLVRVFDVAFDGYNGGMATDCVDLFSDDDINRFNAATYDKSGPYSGQSMIVMAVPRLNKKLPNPTWMLDAALVRGANVIPDHSKRCTDIDQHSLETQAASVYPVVQYHLAKVLGMPTWSQLSDNNERPGSTCIEDITELQLMSFSGQLRIFHNDVCVEELQGAGHLGPSYVGVASVREGRGLTVQPGRPTLQRLV